MDQPDAKRTRGLAPVVSIGGGLVLLIVILGLALVVSRLLWREGLSELAPAPEPLVVEARSASFDERIAASLQLTWTDPEAIISPAWSGIVTAVRLKPGDTLQDRDTPLSVDGTSRMAAATASPFWRPLDAGDSGPDVKMLEELLSRIAIFDTAADDEFDQETATAVGRLAQLLGIGGNEARAFEPSWLIWLPRSPFPVGEVLIFPGGTAPAGSQIVLGRAGLSGADVLDPNSIPLTLDPSKSWVFEAAGDRVSLDVSDQVTVADQALSDLARGVAPGTEAVAGFVVLRTPRTAVVVPPSAVLSGPTGVLCVWQDTDAGHIARRVEVGQGTFSETEVEGIESGARILSNPGLIVDRASCRSN